MNWEKHVYPGGLNATEQEEWFDSIGFTDYFTFSSTGDNIDLYAKVEPWGTEETDKRLYIGIPNANNPFSVTSSSKPYVRYVNVYNRSSSTLWSNQQSNAYLTDTDGINFDKLETNDIVLWNIYHKGDATHRFQCVIAFIKTAEEIDTANSVVLSYVGSLINSSPDATPSPQYYAYTFSDSNVMTGTNSGGNIVQESRNYGIENYILQPFYINGYKTSLYTIDGGLNRITKFREFIINGHSFYMLGQGFAVKVS